MRGDFSKIYLACRNPARAQASQSDLTRVTGKSIFDVAIIDLADLASVRAAIPTLDRPLNALVINAGGTGGPHAMALTADGVTEIFAANILGHVVLLEELLDQGALIDVAVLTGSEAARGVRKLGIPRPTFVTHTADEFTTVIDGTFSARKPNLRLAYGQVKYLGALWMAAQARKHADIRFITMSPGNTSGTDALRDLPAPVRLLAQHVLMPYVAPALGIAHKLEDGAKRLATAVTTESLQSGVFYASAAHTIIGPVMDQADIVPDFRDPLIQDHAAEAIHRFIR